MSRIGVDFGANAVRVVEVGGLDSDGFAVVTRVGIAPLKSGAVAAGKVRNPQLVSLALSRALKQAGLNRAAASQGVVLGISSQGVAMGRVSLPTAVRVHEREGALRGMGIEVSPTVPLADSYLSTQVVSSSRGAEGHSEDSLAVLAALRSEVDAVTGVAKLVGALPRAVDLTGVATVRALVRTTSDDQGIASIVDVGASKIMVATRQGPHVRSVRTSPGGGDEITRTIVAVTGESLPDAELRKSSLRLTSATTVKSADPLQAFYMEEDHRPATSNLQDELDEALERSTESILEQIASSIESDGVNHGSFTQGISLCGGTSLLRGFKERLSQRVGVPVQIGAPWAVLDPSRRNTEFLSGGQADPQLMLQLSTAIGLALWKEPT